MKNKVYILSGIVFACFLILGAYLIGVGIGEENIMNDPTIIRDTGTLVGHNLNVYENKEINVTLCSTLYLKELELWDVEIRGETFNLIFE